MSARPPRVLHVTDHLWPGGAERLTVGLVAELARLDRAESVLCTVTARDADPELVERAREGAHALRALRLRRLADIRILERMVRLGREHDVELVHSHPGVGHLHSRWAARILGIPHLTTLHTMPGPEIEDNLPRMTLDALTARLSALVVAPCHAVADAYRRRWRLPAERFAVVPNAPVAGPAPADFDAGPLRRSLAGDGGARLVICVARLQPAKGLEDLIAALPALRREVGPVRLVVAGDGPEEPRLRAEAELLGVADDVLLLGRRDDVGELLAAADAFCLPSRHEGVPVSLLEAMASGVPAVATAVGGVPELLAAGRGLLVAPGQPVALAGALARLLSDAELARGMSDASREQVARHHEMPVVAERYADIYDRLVARARP